MKTLLQILIAMTLCVVSGVDNKHTITISGKVYDKNGAALDGVTVRAFANYGTSLGSTKTKDGGNYKLKLTIKNPNVPIDLIQYNRVGYFHGVEVNISHKEPSVINKVLLSNPEGPLSFRNAYTTSLSLRMILVLRGGAPQIDWLEVMQEQNPDQYDLAKENRNKFVKEIGRINGQLTQLQKLANTQQEFGRWSKSEFETIRDSILTTRSMTQQIRYVP